MMELNPKFAGLQLQRSAPGEHDAGNQHRVAGFQRPEFFLGEGKGKFGHNKTISFATVDHLSFRQML
jgi:hypothetical protein